MIRFVVLLGIASISYGLISEDDFDEISLECRRLMLFKKDNIKDMIKSYKKEYKALIQTFGKGASRSWATQFNEEYRSGVNKALTAASVCFHLNKEFEACNVGFKWGDQWDPRFQDVVVEQEQERVGKFIEHTVNMMLEKQDL